MRAGDGATGPEERWERVLQLFHAALDVAPAERTAFIATACGDDDELCADVVSLVDASAGSEGFLTGLAGRAGTLYANAGAAVPAGLDTLGAYRLVRRIGQGGMGAVYLAERADDTFEKDVAIKVLPPALWTDGMRRRFAAERRILARLEHPGIARLLDAGVAADDTPFLVMEYVRGEPIDRYCESKKLSIEERLRLFMKVCDAVDYAHSSFVVHRDLKPSNILVTDTGDVKLLDFGISKVLDPDESADATMLTHAGGRPMTPTYASPEQIQGGQITTATDVYSLGILLYVLLAGRRPYELAGLTGAGAERVICEQQVAPPSSAVLVPPPHAAADRLSRQLRGDLDTIVLTALRKEPERRYRSASLLSRDIENYLASRPITALPASTAYRLRRFARRRPQVLAALTVAVLAAAGYVGTVTRYATRLAAERDRARTEAVKAEQVSGFLVGLFAANDPDAGSGAALTVLDMLQRGEEQAGELDDQPAVQAQMLHVIGQMNAQLGHFARADTLFRRALVIRRRLHPTAHPDLAATLNRLGSALQSAGHYDDAELVLLEAVDVARRAGDGALEADGNNDLGLAYYGRGAYVEAEAAHRAVLAQRIELLGDRHPRTANSRHNLALALTGQGRWAEAEPLYIDALEAKRDALGPDHTDVALTVLTLGRLYSDTGDHEKAAPLLEEALRAYRARLGPSHPSVALTLNDLGALAARMGRHAQAELYFEEALAIREVTLGVEHPYVAISLSNLAYVLAAQGKLADAATITARALALSRARLGDRHDNTATFATNYGDLLHRLGRHAEAEALHRESIATLYAVLPAGHTLVTRPLAGLGRLLIDTGRAAEAVPFLTTAIEIRTAGGEHVGAAVLKDMLGASLAGLGRHAEARALLVQAYDELLDLVGADHARTITARARLHELYPPGP